MQATEQRENSAGNEDTNDGRPGPQYPGPYHGQASDEPCIPASPVSREDGEVNRCSLSPQIVAMQDFFSGRVTRSRTRRAQLQAEALSRPALPVGKMRSTPGSVLLARPITARGNTVEDAIVIDDDDDGNVPTVRQSRAKVHVDVTDQLLVIFSDGSVLKNVWGGAGIAYWHNGHWTGKAVALGCVKRDSLEAEASAIVEAMKLAGDLVRPHHKVVEICSDHQGLVQAFQHFSQKGSKDPLVHSVADAVKRLSSKNVAVQLTWVKGHNVHAGNEMADHLARMAAERSLEGYTLGMWNTPAYSAYLGDVAVNRGTLLGLSASAVRSANRRFATQDKRNAKRQQRIERRMQEREVRRLRKVQYRMERSAQRPLAMAA